MKGKAIIPGEIKHNWHDGTAMSMDVRGQIPNDPSRRLAADLFDLTHLLVHCVNFY